MSFKEVIKQIRKEQKMTQKELAAKLNVKQTTLSAWETGENIPSLLKVIEIANVLNVSSEDLTLLLLNDLISTAA